VLRSQTPPKYLRPSDRTILRWLSRLPSIGSQKGSSLVGDDGGETLVKALATGRCRWQGVGGPVLAQGTPRPGTLGWRLDADGRQRSRIVFEAGGDVLPMAPPWYVDAQAGLCGPIVTELAPQLLAAILAAPPLTVAEVAEVRTRLGARVPKVMAYLPSEPKPPRRIQVDPIPRLHLFHQRVVPTDYRSYGRRDFAPFDLPLARLTFVYAGHDLPGPASEVATMRAEGDTVAEIVRNQRAERAALRQLETRGFRSGHHPALLSGSAAQRDTLTPASGYSDSADEETWLDFLIEVLPRLRADGWQVDIAEDFPIRLASAESEPEAELTEGRGIDWFDLHLGMQVDGERVDILPAILTLLRKLPTDGLDTFLDELIEDGDGAASFIRLRLEDGRILPLAASRLGAILKSLVGLFAAGWDSGTPGFSRADAADLAAFAEATAASGLVWRGGEALRAMGEKLRAAAGIPPVALPDLFAGVLRSYQHVGVAWMQLLREVGLGGVLADDMGLGKTVQTLAHLAIEKAAGRHDRPSLIVAPTSVLPNWRAEAAQFVPSLRVLPLHGAARKNAFDLIGDADIVLTTYPLLARDIEILAARPWHMVIIDEAQAVKNPLTAAAKALRRLDVRHRLALTGTPLENHLGELWALFDFVSPGFLGDARSFTKSWRTPIENQGDGVRQEILARRIRPFLLRRTKTLVAADLPPKTEIIERIELSPSQRDFYEGIRLVMRKKVAEAIAAKGLRRSRIEFLDALLKLRQACCDPRLVKTAGAKIRPASAKLDRLMEMLPEMIAEGRRILLFSQFTSMLSLIEAELKDAAIPYVLLTGETVDRATPVKRFQRGDAPLFLISLKAGGTGLNLTASDTVIHYDPWWNPAVEAQATDRAHRIGQDKPVFVHRLVSEDTIEVKMAELKARKQALADGLLGGGEGAALDLGEDDIEFLLGS
jgi:superfamily II DNA or RNA helicase